MLIADKSNRLFEHFMIQEYCFLLVEFCYQVIGINGLPVRKSRSVFCCQNLPDLLI